ncbi:hypothetical protein [Micromonospora sp. CPCC 205556]|uniref:hypothetical protein n=1 Tax=Micromonospora sp. CPCC 205556 TaxID=3122398 RepID=UPI003FA585A7
MRTTIEDGCLQDSTNLQVAIDASARLVIAVGDPQPGNPNDTIVYRGSGIDQKLDGRPVAAVTMNAARSPQPQGR